MLSFLPPNAQPSVSVSRYLDVILRLDACSPNAVRVKDIARELGLLKGSVSGALKNLKAQGLVDYRPYRPIRLTAAGREMAEISAERIRILAQFLTAVLGIDPQEADAAARRMEPYVRDLVVERMWHYLREQYPRIALPAPTLRLVVSRQKRR